MDDCQVVVFGNLGVGKSSLVIQLTQGQFIEEYDSTIQDSYRKQISVDNFVCNLDILDTVESDEFAVVSEQITRSAEGFLLVYSITSINSFNNLNDFRDRIVRIKDKDNLPMVLVGNKCDSEEREVTTKQGESMAERFRCPFIETSAKVNINVEEAFHSIVREIRRNFSCPSK